jgi:pseudouridine synthase
MADAGVASRRECERIVEEGLVTVNGKRVARLPAFVDALHDDIRVSGRKIKRPRRNIYVMLFKPRGFVCTARDPEGRKTAVDLVKHPTAERLFTVGRLDLESSGLLLLTDDGELANILTHPKYEIHKGYDVTVRGRVEPEAVEKLRRGVYLAERDGTASRTRESSVVVLRRERDRTRMHIELREGRNRQIRRLCERIGHPVKKLRRTRLGPLRLKGLAVGEWRELTSGELASLKRAARKASTKAAKAPPRKKRRSARRRVRQD